MQREPMTEKEKRQKAYGEEWWMRMYGMTVEATAVCANCEYFKRHYVIVEEDKVRIVPTPGGHCTFLRTKRRKETDYCDHFKLVAVPGLPISYEFDSLLPFISGFWRMKGTLGTGPGHECVRG